VESQSSGESVSPKRSRHNYRHKDKQKGKHRQANISASTIHEVLSDSSSLSSEAFCVASEQQNCVDEWFADSGATEHMTDKREWFQSFQSIDNLTWSVSVADDHKLYVRGVGDIIVQAKVNDTITLLKLKNVLYVPKLRRNLISTSRLTEKRVAILHIRDICKMISDDGKGRLLMTAHKHGGLWRMDIQAVVNKSSVSVAESNFETQVV